MSQMRGPDPTPAEEAAARELCRLRGVDPDEIVMHEPLDGSGYAVCLKSPRYRLAAHEIRGHAQVHAAMEPGRVTVDSTWARELAAAEAFTQTALERVCRAVGIDTPLQPTAIATSDEETTLDLLVKHLSSKRAALAAAEARIRGLEQAATDMCREWRLHGQLTDSCRPMERVLGIHAPFCPTWGHKDCECDLSLAPPPEAAKRGEE